MLKNPRHSQSGNVFLIILIGIALFAALGYTVARGFRSDTTSTLSKRRAELAAGEILDYAQKVGRVVDRLRARGCSESEISFENPEVSGYEHTPAARDECKVFGSSGGQIAYRIPSAEWLDRSYSALTNYQEWYFTHSSCIDGIGTGDVDCHLDDTAYKEIFLVLKYLKRNICEKINERLLGDNTITTDGNAMFRKDRKYDGDFSSINGIRLEGANRALHRCMQGGIASYDEPAGSYHFYNILVVR